jgi:hypothetical protein
MKVKGILIENEQGEEFLVTLRDMTSVGRPAFIVERRERGTWRSSELPARQSVAVTAMALMGLSALAERCGLRLTWLPSHAPETGREYPVQTAGSSLFHQHDQP